MPSPYTEESAASDSPPALRPTTLPLSHAATTADSQCCTAVGASFAPPTDSGSGGIAGGQHPHPHPLATAPSEAFAAGNGIEERRYLSIIEDGDHVGAADDDFGLSGAEISMHDVSGMELGAMQPMDEFLEPKTTNVNGTSGEAVPSLTATSEVDLLPAARTTHTTTCTSSPMVASTVRVGSPVVIDSEDARQLESGDDCVPAIADAGTVESSLVKPTGVHYLSQRADKIRQIQSHPIVQSLSKDGREVLCRCGKRVRLNPPWYIIKFEQHVVSRNCTFLRRSGSRKRARTMPVAGAMNMPVPTRETTCGNTAVPANIHLANYTNNDGTESEGPRAVSDSSFSVGQMAIGSNGGNATIDPREYCLKTADDLLKDHANLSTDSTSGGINSCDPSAPTTESHSEKKRKALLKMQTHPYFARATPDGRFVECKCEALIILHAPWELQAFFKHVVDKKKPPEPTRKRSDKNSGSEKKKPRLGDGAAIRVQKRQMMAREARWVPVAAKETLPCPGVRESRVNEFITCTTQITGGSRPRRRIAEDLFPHLFTDTKPDEQPRRLLARLSPDEKLILHDAVESEALWFVDRDAVAVRSLDCTGIISPSNGEEMCSGCKSLCSNTSLRMALTLTVLKNQALQTSPSHSGKGKSWRDRRLSLLDREFGKMNSRLLRNLFAADIEDGSVKNVWFDMAEMGILGLFNTRPTFLGLIESMTILKDKERRGVGLQNMTYNKQLDAFMKAVSNVSPEACDFFQQHLGGRKQRYLVAKTCRVSIPPDHQNSERSDTTELVATTGAEAGPDIHGQVAEHEAESSNSVPVVELRPVYQDGEPVQTVSEAPNGGSTAKTSGSDTQNSETTLFAADLVHSTTHSGPQGVEETESEMDGVREHATAETIKDVKTGNAKQQLKNDESKGVDNGGRDNGSDDECASDSGSENESGSESESDGDGFAEYINDSSTSNALASSMLVGFTPCKGLRDEKVQAYVTNAVQIIGGSRPKYVIARELYPEIFSGAQHVKMTKALSETQRLVLQDAVFSECLWRVDKAGSCVRSLRCARRIDRKRTKQSDGGGVCRACLDLKSVANFRSVLARAKIPKKVENLKYVPSVYTESDPFMRKLSKNASLRALYKAVKATLYNKDNGDGAANSKKVTFWLRFAKLGLFGHFRSHPVFEALISSMVEIKDKERRGVGKQNMQYARALDYFMNALSSVSIEAFDLFALHFCGRTSRSQKGKKRKAIVQLYDAAMQSALSGAATSSATVDVALSYPRALAIADLHLQHQQSMHPSAHLLSPDDLLTVRAISTADIEESQRFMDRIMDEVRMSVNDELTLQDAKEQAGEQERQQRHKDPQRARGEEGTGESEDSTGHVDNGDLDPQTYLDEDGVLSTIL